MNTYRVMGTYQLWDNPTISRENFMRIVVAEDTEQALRILNLHYKDIEVVSTTLTERDVIISPECIAKPKESPRTERWTITADSSVILTIRHPSRAKPEKVYTTPGTEIILDSEGQ